MKKLIKAVVVIGLLGLSAGANALNVGGVEWTPGVPSGGADQDTTLRYSFNQWFTNSGSQAINGGLLDPTNAIASNTVAANDVLQGVGEVSAFNGNTVSTDSLTGGIPGSFCSGCELTFAFGGFTVAGAGAFTGGWLNLYVDTANNFDVADNPFLAANANTALDGTLWLSMLVDSSAFSNFDDFNSGALTTYLSVTGGLAKDYFNTDSLTKVDSGVLSDFLQSASASFFNRDEELELVGTGTGQMAGLSTNVPEPESLALIGIGLLGFAAARRKA